jgi:hypothetical protein
MATIYATFSAIMSGDKPVYATASRAAQKLTTSASSQQFTYAAQGNAEYVSLSVSGGSVAVAINGNPTAVSGAAGTHFLMDGNTKEFGPLKPGDLVAVIDA